MRTLKELRKEAGITQPRLAELSGVSVMTFKRIELGNTNPTVDIMNRLLEPLGLTLDIVSLSD